MPEDLLRSRFLELIDRTSGERLQEVSDLLRRFKEAPRNNVLSFAGSGNDMEKSDFKDWVASSTRDLSCPSDFRDIQALNPW